MYNEENLEQFIEQPTAPVVEEPQQQVEEKIESNKEYNMRMMRERLEAAERRSLELERMIQQNMNQNQPSQKIELIDEYDGSDLEDDSFAEGKHLKKTVKSVNAKINELKKLHQQTQVQQIELQLRSAFSDFDKVVSAENLEKLKQNKPFLYKSIISNPDLYEKGQAAYDIIKNSTFYADKNKYEDVDKRIEQNKNKPRSIANVSPQTSDTPLAKIGDYDRRILTEERKAEIRRQVEEAKRNRQ